MHLRHCLLAAVLLAFAQVSTAGFSLDIFNEIPLTTQCNGIVPIPDGEALVRVFSVYGDQWPEGTGYGEAPVSHWLINGEAELGIPGGFHTVGGFSVPWYNVHGSIFYMVVDYPAVNPVIRWTSGEIWVLPGENPDHYCINWSCRYDPPPCDPQNPDTTWMIWSSYEWAVCVPFCSEGSDTRTVCLGPFAQWCQQLFPDANHAPFWVNTFAPSCAPFFESCAPIQIAGYWHESLPGQYWICGDFQLESGSASGYAYISLDLPLSGGASEDCWLPVELLSFTAVPQDQSIVLNWTTASETNMSHFEITRDGSHLDEVAASNHATGSSYQWRDVNLENDREYSYTLTSVDFDGSSEVIGQLSATPRADEVPTEFALLQNYPNPFNASTTIEFTLPEASEVSLTLHNLLGEQVARLSEGSMSAGQHRVNLEASSLASGLYFYRLVSGNHSAQRKLVLIK